MVTCLMNFPFLFVLLGTQMHTDTFYFLYATRSIIPSLKILRHSILFLYIGNLE